ncbi:MAG TPA: tetratricopeptide repeat protein [Thermoanaerobaculia bacterium]|nr:tetratricopeptide repeat protein [Thermoanaerobaculia bacterium]
MALAVGTLTVLAFLPALRCGFVHLDDPQTVPRYAAVMRGLTWDGVRLAFGDQFFGHYVPLTVLSLMLDWQLWGRVAYGHHLTSVLLHGINAALVFLLWRRATCVGLGVAQTWRAAAVALLVAVHPLRVEPVLWLTGRKDLLAGAGGLLALWLYVRWREAPSRRRWLAVTLAFAAALLGKATALVVPALMLLLDFWPLERVFVRDRQDTARDVARRVLALVVEKLPWLAMSAAAGVGALLSARAGEAMAELDVVPLSQRAATAAVGSASYLRMTFWPTRLAAFYPLPAAGWSAAQVTAAAALLVALTIAAIAAFRRFPWITVGWLWWLACLLPVSGLLQAGEQAAADRYTYFASIGLTMAIVWTVAAWALRAHWRRVAAVSALALALLASTAATRAQILTWRDSETVFRRMVAVTRGTHFGHLNLANVLAESGRLPEAVREYREAIRLRPDVALAWTGLGAALRRQGDTAGARAALERALQQSPDLSAAHLQLAALYEEQGALGPAAGHLARVITLEPRHAQAWQGLASILGRPGAAKQALPFVTAIARSHPDSPDVARLLSVVRQRAAAEDRSAP